MVTASNSRTYQNPAWGQRPAWQNQAQTPAWNPPFWHPDGMSRPAGIAAMILGFAVWWPVGLATLFFMIASGRMGCRRRRWSQDMNQNPSPQSNWSAPWSNAPWSNFSCNWGANAGPAKPASSGNHAFDEYRADTLRRMEEEQAEFSGFLDRLRMAKDKAEFDQFMAERRQSPKPPMASDVSPPA